MNGLAARAYLLEWHGEGGTFTWTDVDGHAHHVHLRGGDCVRIEGPRNMRRFMSAAAAARRGADSPAS